MNKALIKKGSMELSLDRSDFIGVDQTPDGVVFNFKLGIQLHVVDVQMPIYTKDLMKNTSDSFSGGNLIFNLTDYNRPVSVDAT